MEFVVTIRWEKGFGILDGYAGFIEDERCKTYTNHALRNTQDLCLPFCRRTSSEGLTTVALFLT
jgi:hypothetical protein